jgi:hypothetical protein
MTEGEDEEEEEEDEDEDELGAEAVEEVNEEAVPDMATEGRELEMDDNRAPSLSIRALAVELAMLLAEAMVLLALVTMAFHQPLIFDINWDDKLP